MIGAIIGDGLYSKYAMGIPSELTKKREQKKAENEQKQAEKDALIKKNYNEIYNHELAHKLAGGALAGDIVIEYNADGIPFAGHVDIRMPKLNQENPKQTINEAETVIRSAMAPFDPSDQDYRVANQARTIKAQAQELQNQKRLNIIV